MPPRFAISKKCRISVSNSISLQVGLSKVRNIFYLRDLKTKSQTVGSACTTILTQSKSTLSRLTTARKYIHADIACLYDCVVAAFSLISPVSVPVRQLHPHRRRPPLCLCPQLLPQGHHTPMCRCMSISLSSPPLPAIAFSRTPQTSASMHIYLAPVPPLPAIAFIQTPHTSMSVYIYFNVARLLPAIVSTKTSHTPLCLFISSSLLAHYCLQLNPRRHHSSLRLCIYLALGSLLPVIAFKQTLIASVLVYVRNNLTLLPHFL